MSAPRLTREQLELFLPGALAGRVLEGNCEALAPRRFDASVLSCDVSDFRPLTEADGAAAIEVLNLILAEVATAIAVEGGTLLSFPGDGALAVFGAPLVMSDHRQRADRAAVAISGTALEAGLAELARRGLPAVGMDVAVESGPVLGAVIGAEPRWEYAAIGAATSRAIARTSG